MRLLECPRDGEILATNDLPSLQYHSCETCAGVWLPGRTLRAVLTRAGIEELSGAPRGTGPAPACPECRQPTDPVDLRGIPVDVCPACGGVWLDGGELARIGNLLRSNSGLAEAHHGAADAGTTGRVVLVDLLLNVVALVLGGTPR